MNLGLRSRTLDPLNDLSYQLKVRLPGAPASIPDVFASTWGIQPLQ